jgi:uncharacterized cupin superfamily protein
MSSQSVQRVNVAALELAHFPNLPAGFCPDIARVGKLLGAARTGMSVYELPPGEAVGPYHYEDPEEEWLLVVDGRPTLRHPSGEDELEPWDVVFFPPGPDGAHMVRNDTDFPARVLMFSSITAVAAVVYPDSDKISIWTTNGADDIVVRRMSGVDYWEGESRRRPELQEPSAHDPR